MPVRRNLYPGHVREAVVYQYFNLDWSAQAIAAAHGGHPCERTVHNIINEYMADTVEGLPGEDWEARLTASTVLASLVSLQRNRSWAL